MRERGEKIPVCISDPCPLFPDSSLLEILTSAIGNISQCGTKDFKMLFEILYMLLIKR